MLRASIVCCAGAVLLALLLLGQVSVTTAAPVPVKVERSYVFTDEFAVIQGVGLPDGAVPGTVRLITVAGVRPAVERELTVRNGAVRVQPMGEGIHVVEFPGTNLAPARFLAMNPPEPIDAAKVRERLPHGAEILLSGQPFRFVAMGDSITNTGDYETMLVMMLQRVIPQASITFSDRSYPGRSVDATVRNFEADAVAFSPHLGLLMYGVNDLRGGAPVDGYVEQCLWIAQQLKQRCNADTILLTPTPEISISKEFTGYGAGIVDMLRFGNALTEPAAAQGVLIADTFHAMWGEGGASFDASGRRMWTLFPPSYSRQLQAIAETSEVAETLETPRKTVAGDGTHPNALGHLLIARAVFNAITGTQVAAPALHVRAESRWKKEGLVSTVWVRNRSDKLRAGRLEIAPLKDGPVTPETAREYQLEPGQELSFELRWREIGSPADLLKFPANVYVAPGKPMFCVTDFSAAGGSYPHAVVAPIVPAGNFVRHRQIVTGRKVNVPLTGHGLPAAMEIELPGDVQVGRIPLVKEFRGENDATGHAVAELAFVQFAGALRGEAQVDGSLEEWRNSRWIPVGLPVQARGSQGVSDHRASVEACDLRWAFKVGEAGLFIAVQAVGPMLENDNFTLFFDPRELELLGTPGRYYWVAGKFKPEGKLSLTLGETSPKKITLAGAWRATERGRALEMFLPYAVFEQLHFPARGDLGLSIWWVHQGPDGVKTNLFWSEDAHAWSPRWYGVLRLCEKAEEELPFVVRVK